jgi:hypothetical protein
MLGRRSLMKNLREQNGCRNCKFLIKDMPSGILGRFFCGKDTVEPDDDWSTEWNNWSIEREVFLGGFPICDAWERRA